MRFDKGVNGNITYPIINQSTIDNLPNLDIVSVFSKDNPRVIIDPTDIIFPSYTEDNSLWEELTDVARLVYLAKNDVKLGKTKEVIKSIDHILDPENPFCSRTIQQYYNVKTYKDGAMLVRNDYPLHILSSLSEFLLKRGAKVRNILPSVSFKRFTDSIVLSSHVIGWAVHTVSPNAFASKWYHGRPRPEEVIYAWANGDVTVDPMYSKQLENFVDMAEVLSDPRKFTLYSEGCPNHPSYPAMHGAAAGAGLLLPVLFDLTEAEEEEVRRTVLNIAMFRDVAGVHYESDSLMGIQLGEMVIEQALPGFLETYGANRSEIEDLISIKKRVWIS